MGEKSGSLNLLSGCATQVLWVRALTKTKEYLQLGEGVSG